MRFFGILMLLLPVCSYALSPAEVKRWQTDLDFYAEQLSQKHIDLFHSMSAQEFDQTLTQLKDSLPELSHNQVLVEMMRLTHNFGDGHTSFPLWDADIKSFPVEFKWLNGGLYVVGTTPAFRHLLGARLDAIDDIDANEVYRQFARITPFSENPFSTGVRVAQYLSKAELLNGLGIVATSERAQFRFNLAGNTIQESLDGADSHDISVRLSINDSASFNREEVVNDNLWFGASEDRQVVYVKFRRYSTMSTMESFAEDVYDFIYKHHSKKLIIDLRDNYGGNFFVGLKLAEGLVLADSIDWRSGVYVLINPTTFSAAMSNAAQYKQLLNATLVGEPTGAKPSGYQDMGQFSLPNSELPVTYSKRLYHFDSSGKDALYPDMPIDISIENYRSGDDPQLGWILEQLKVN